MNRFFIVVKTNICSSTAPGRLFYVLRWFNLNKGNLKKSLKTQIRGLLACILKIGVQKIAF